MLYNLLNISIKGNFDGVTVKKFRLVRICEALNCDILDVIELENDNKK